MAKSGLGWTVDDEYYMEEVGTIAIVNGRTFSKTVAGPCIVINACPGGSGYSGPIVLSTEQSYAQYDQGNTHSTLACNYLGMRWYMTEFNYWYSGTISSTGGKAIDVNLSGKVDWSNTEKIALYILSEVVNVRKTVPEYDIVTRKYLSDIANAIRRKLGESAEEQTYLPSQMATAILSIPTGGSSIDVIYSSDHTLAVKIDVENNRLIWYFMGFTKSADDMMIPLPVQQTGLLYSLAYGSDKTTQNGNIGFYNGKIRSWDISLANLSAGTFWGVVYSDGGQQQTNPYSDPPSPQLEPSNIAWEEVGQLAAGANLTYEVNEEGPYFIIAKMLYSNSYQFFSIGNSVNGTTSRIIFGADMSSVTYNASAGAANSFMTKSGNIWTIGNDSYLSGDLYVCVIPLSEIIQ